VTGGRCVRGVGMGGKLAGRFRCPLHVMSADSEAPALTAEPSGPDLDRRAFLRTATIACGAVGVAFAAVPFIESWLPSETARALGAPVEINTSKIDAGQMIVTLWRRRPIFVLHRTDAQLQMLREGRDTALLRDPNSRVLQQPEYARNWHRSIKPEYLVVVGICTHLGCLPRYEPQLGGTLGADWPGGYFCPCHGSRYDLAARVFTGVPAPYNLPVPPHRFLGESIVRVGENPPGSDFSFDSIVQV